MKQRIEHVALRHLLALAASPAASPAVQAIAQDVIEDLRASIAALPPLDPLTRAHRRAALAMIAGFTAAPDRFRDPATLPPPPGMPI